VYHITGVVVMVMALQFLATPTKNDSSKSSEVSASYSKLLRRGCMSDIEINLGFIDGDIIALCDDADAHYAFHATLKEDGYFTRMASSHGLVSNVWFTADMGERQMVMSAMAQHLDLLEKMQSGEIEVLESIGERRH
jgi:hypothetical protein